MERTLKNHSERKITWREDLKANGTLYLLFLPVLAWLILFHYIPLGGILIAFEDYSMTRGILQSEWVGLQNFINLFTGEGFWGAFRNTCAMAVLQLTLGFIPPILFALVLTSYPHKRMKRGVQLTSYLPYFVSAVVMCSLLKEFMSEKGAVTALLTLFGAEPQNWLANPNVPVFWIIYTLLGVWQGMGWGSIIYVTAISNVSGELHEAAALDGANRLQRVWHVVLPGIAPLIIMMWTVSVGTVFKTIGNNILLLYMPTTYNVADVLSTYTYRMSFGEGVADFGLSTASGLFQSLIGMILLITSNKLSRKIAGSSLF